MFLTQFKMLCLGSLSFVISSPSKNSIGSSMTAAISVSRPAMQRSSVISSSPRSSLMNFSNGFFTSLLPYAIFRAFRADSIFSASSRHLVWASPVVVAAQLFFFAEAFLLNLSWHSETFVRSFSSAQVFALSYESKLSQSSANATALNITPTPRVVIVIRPSFISFLNI